MELDVLVRELHALREGAGQPSFGDIALGVSRVRRERGMAPERARVGRTTVYDAFRVGRRRLDAELVSDIVLALGGTTLDAERLAARCLAAQSSRSPAPPIPDPVEPPRSTIGVRTLAVLLVASVVVNVAGRFLVDALGLPLYLDMIGTAFSAIVLGPWWGALVGATSNVVGTSSSGPDSLWFIPVNVAGALVWGYGARRWRMASSIPRFFLLCVAVAVVCTAVASTTIVAMLDGFTGHGSDDITTSVLDLSHSLWVSVSVSNLLTSVSDKLLAGFVSLAVIESLPGGMRVWAPTGWMRGGPERQAAVRVCSGLPEHA